MNVDVTKTIEFRASVLRLLWLGLGGLAFLAIGFVLAYTYAGTGHFREFAGWGCGVLSALVIFVSIRRAFDVRTPTLTLSPAGFTDRRISAEPIAWSSVLALSMWQPSSATKAVVAKVSESVWERPGISKAARWGREANRSLGADGLSIGVFELPVKADDLLSMMEAYAKAHGSRIN